MSGKAVLGFVGLGSMGSGMAPHLVEPDRRVLAYDVARGAVDAFREQGGEGAASLAEIGSEADIVFLSLPTPQVVKDVALGGELLGKRTRLIIDLSTCGPKTSIEVGEGLAKAGVSFIDAPVSGGKASAAKGTLAIMAACKPELRDEAHPLLAKFGKVFFVGDAPGQAQTMKLINNMLSVVALAATAEGMAMGVKAGLDPQIMLDVLNASSGVNSATRDKFPRAVLPRTFAFGFATGLSIKDINLFQEEAKRIGTPMIVCPPAQTMMEITQAKFGADSDFTSVVRVVEEWAGVEIKARG